MQSLESFFADQHANPPAPFNPHYDPTAKPRMDAVTASMERDGYYTAHTREECAAEIQRRLFSTESRDYRVSDSFLSAIINGDTSGMRDDDMNVLTPFLTKHDARFGHWSYDADNYNFGRCDICGLGAHTVLLQWVAR